MAKGAPGIGELRALLKKKSFLPVYLVHGEEDFLLEESVAAIIAAAMPHDERTFNLDILDCAEVDAREITARASSLPMMGERRVVVARNIEKLNAKDLELLAAYVERPSETTVLVLTGRKVDLRKKLFAGLRAAGAECACARLSDSKLSGWVTDRVRELGGTIDDEAAALIAARIGSSLLELDSEIAKLLIFNGAGKAISVEAVAAVGGFSREFSHFNLQDAIGTGNLPHSLTILDHMIEEGAEFPYIIWALTDYFSLLWRLHHLMTKPGRDDKEGFRLTKSWAWKKQAYLAALQKYPAAKIENIFRMLAEADLQSKSGSHASKRDHLHPLLVKVMGEAGSPPTR